jgi:molybdate transport system substrate-binding protein
MATPFLRRGAQISAIASILALGGLPWLYGVNLAAAPAAERNAGDGRGAVEARAVLVFAAASLTDALDQVDRAYAARTGVEVKASFAASSLLAKQIEAGAPADVFFSADRESMDYLEQRGLLKPGSRRDLLGNALVLVAPVASTVQLKIATGFDLAGALQGGRLATGDPDSVPVGRYARAALSQLGVWPQLSARLVRAENVRAALEYVARGEAPLGIVYRTDAEAEKRVRLVDTFPADTHPPITYPVALTVQASSASESFMAFLASDAAREIFSRYGFEPLARSP